MVTEQSTDASDEGQTALLREYYNRAARHYDSWMAGFDRVMLGTGRSRMCSRARGPTLELAVGTGANLPFYPPDATITGIDLSPAMLNFAEKRAQKLDLDVDLKVGDAENLDFPDEQFETVTATLLMSAVADPRRVAQEMRRVLQPGGRLLILDFARSPIAPVRLVEKAPSRLTARARLSLLRDPLDYLGPAEFTLEHVDRFRCGVIVEIVARRS